MNKAGDLERIIGHSPVIVFHWRAEPGWPVEYVSGNVSRLGYSPEEFYSGRLTYARVVHPDDLESVGKMRAQVARGVERLFLRYRLVASSGEICQVEEHSFILRDTSGRAVGFEGLVLDVTERTRLERPETRLRHFERVLLDALPMPAFLKDTSLIYRGCNQAFADYVGVPREKIVDAGVKDLWAPDLAQTYDRKDRELLADPLGVQVYEAQVTYADGTRHEVVFHKSTFRDEDGALAGIVGILVDVTERNQALRQLKEANDLLEQRVGERTADLSLANQELGQQISERMVAERRLRESEQRFRELAESLPQVVFETDLEGRLTWVNRIAYSVFGYRPEKALSELHAPDLIAPEDRERASRNLRAVLASQGPEYSEYTAVRCDGSRFSVMASSRPIQRAGRLVGVRGMLVDISARVAVERMKDEFLSIASHELRTPLASLHLLIAQGQRRLKQGQPVDAAALEKMDKQSRQLKKLIDDLLDVTRLEHGVLTIHPNRLDLRATVAAILTDFRDQHPDLALSLELPAKPIAVLADPGRIGQVLTNLLDNAFKYGGGTPIEVRLTQESESARLAITDHGPGIPADLQARLFTRFFRAAKPCQPGLGLGLCICRAIIEQHHGRVEVQSEVGRGSTFSFTLPTVSQADEAALVGQPQAQG